MLIFDLETNGLLDTVTTIHCAVTYNTDTDVYTRYRPDDMNKLMADLKAAPVIGGHNIITFDIPVIKKLFGINLYDTCEIVDTLILSRLAYYNLYKLDEPTKLPKKMFGLHGLKAWGFRLGTNKGTYGEQEDAWDSFSEEMLEYCEQDVNLNNVLYNRLLSKAVPAEALRIEQEFAKIIQRQVEYGWFFDVKKAQGLHVILVAKKELLYNELLSTFKDIQIWVPLKPAPMYTKKQELSVRYKNQIAKGAHNDLEKGWGYYEPLTFNPGSRAHIRKWMEEVYGWISPKTTEKGTPIINEEVLKDVKFPEAVLLREYFLTQKILGMVAEGKNAWLKLVQDDSRIHGQINTLGAVTGRCTHNKPNVAQTPSSNSFMGKECRQLFTVPKGKKIVGCDASGLELRMLAHYMAIYDEGEYGDLILNGDIHVTNGMAAGLMNHGMVEGSPEWKKGRNNAKTFIYGFLYGAGVAKLGQIVNGSVKQGKRLKTSFLNKLPALEQLSDAVKDKATAGYLLGLNKRKYYIRSEHSALNVLLQGAGALIMKYYLVALEKELSSRWVAGKDYEYIGNIHDEIQIEVNEDIAEDVARVCEAAFPIVEKELNFRVKLEGEAKIGQTWEETH
jgi:DNA polymerase-1